MRVHTFLIHGSRQSLWKICWQGRESTGSVWEKSVSQTEQAELIARGDSRAEQRDTKFFLCGQVQRQRVNEGGGGGWGTVLGIVKCPEKSRNVHAGGRGPSNDSQWQWCPHRRSRLYNSERTQLYTHGKGSIRIGIAQEGVEEGGNTDFVLVVVGVGRGRVVGGWGLELSSDGARGGGEQEEHTKRALDRECRTPMGWEGEGGTYVGEVAFEFNVDGVAVVVGDGIGICIGVLIGIRWIVVILVHWGSGEVHVFQYTIDVYWRGPLLLEIILRIRDLYK